jgi:Tfp pilus assembly major pilin PilA
VKPTREHGFTLIELLVLIIILRVLLAIAIPSYLSFGTRANKSAAQANVRAAVPGMEACSVLLAERASLVRGCNRGHRKPIFFCHRSFTSRRSKECRICGNV